MNFNPSPKVKSGIIVAVAVLLLAGLGYTTIRSFSLSRQTADLSLRLSTLEGNLTSTTTAWQENLTATKQELAGALDTERQNVGAIKEKLGNFEDDVGDITDTVETLEKLSKTDPELLQKYSRVFFLDEHYAPARLTELPADYKYSDAKPLKIHTEVWPFLKKLLEQAAEDKIELYVFSAFRSYNEQNALNNQYTTVYGAGTANQFSADQGYSEHQLGTAVDFITTGLKGQLDGFDKTKASEWLLANAHRFGFILSYPRGNQYYIYEPWHWRFVGVDLAKDLNEDGKHFYDLDQREIDKYLASLFE